MDRKLFLARLNEEVLILNGVIGTLWQSGWLRTDYPPELLNLEKPDIIFNTHRDCIRAGADIISTNTAGANKAQLTRLGLGSETRRLNIRGVEIAQKAAGGRALVAGEIGPLGEHIQPFGKLSFDQALDIYQEQVVALSEGRPDLLIIENISDLKEMRAAVIACHELFYGPLIGQMAFGSNARTTTATDSVTALVVLRALRVDVGGANCSIFSDLENVLKQMSGFDAYPLAATIHSELPPAPKKNDSNPVSPEDFGIYAEKIIKQGVSIFGGNSHCTPEHIREITLRLNHRKPYARSCCENGSLSSRTRTLVFGKNSSTVILGERINPVKRKKISQELCLGKTKLICDEANKQIHAGAEILDICVSQSKVDEAELMAKYIELIQNSVDPIFCLTSSNYSAIQAGLKKVAGKAIINAITGDEKSLNLVLPLAYKYGAAVIARLTTTQDKSAIFNERMKAITRIVEMTNDFGIRSNDIFIDCTPTSFGLRSNHISQILQMITSIKSTFPVKTIVDVGNASIGWRERRVIMNTFLVMAISYGLDIVMMNPYDELTVKTVTAANLLLNRSIRREALFSARLN